MQLSLSVRIAEAACKTRLNIPLRTLLNLAVEHGYEAVCMRASAGGVQMPRADLESVQRILEDFQLPVSMVTADFDVPLNNADGPNSLRDIGPSLDLAELFGCDLVRICLKTTADIEHARRAADAAGERGIRLAHQCHTTTLFEQVDRSLEVIDKIGATNFGIIYEPANLMLCGESYGVDTLQKLAPFLMNVYVQNHQLDEQGPVELDTWCLGIRRFHHIPLWEAGGVDYVKMAAGLTAIQYTGYVTVHQHYAHIMEPARAAEESAQYLRSLG